MNIEERTIEMKEKMALAALCECSAEEARARLAALAKSDAYCAASKVRIASGTPNRRKMQSQRDRFVRKHTSRTERAASARDSNAERAKTLLAEATKIRLEIEEAMAMEAASSAAAEGVVL